MKLMDILLSILIGIGFGLLSHETVQAVSGEERPPRSLCKSWLHWKMGIASGKKIEQALFKEEPLTKEEAEYIIGESVDYCEKHVIPKG